MIKYYKADLRGWRRKCLLCGRSGLWRHKWERPLVAFWSSYESRTCGTHSFL